MTLGSSVCSLALELSMVENDLESSPACVLLCSSLEEFPDPTPFGVGWAR
jgi:hypothetical protein